jgi:hypothetical protein
MERPMWLPKDERQLLRIYYWNIRDRQKKIGSNPLEEVWGTISKDFAEAFEANDWKEAARRFKADLHKSEGTTYREADEKSKEKWNLKDARGQIKRYLDIRSRVDAANAVLAERNLIEVRPHESEDNMGVSFTIEGYDLGRKYVKWHTLIGLWIGEYSWVWLILAGLIGALISQVLNWLF